MTFVLLRSRLISLLQRRVRNGEWTVRALARRSGISQPHLHNVLKGIRQISEENADRLMQAAGLSIFDLLTPDELKGYLEQREIDPGWDQFRGRATSR